MELRQRKMIRLKGYDYSKSGAYFVTICVAQRQMLFWKNVGANCVRPQVHPFLSDIGEIVNCEMQKLNSIYKNVSVDKYVIMPNHIHIIILILQNEDGRTQFAPTISRIIKQFKGSITKKLGFSVWQKSFHDHIIRGEEEYRKIWNYIDTNPLTWEQDCFYAQ